MWPEETPTPVLDLVFGEIDPRFRMPRRHVIARRIVRPVIEVIELALDLLVIHPWEPVWPWPVADRLDNWYWSIRAFRKDRLW